MHHLSRHAQLLEVVALEAPESLLCEDDVRLQRVTEAIASVLLRAAHGPASQPLLYAIGLKARGTLATYYDVCFVFCLSCKLTHLLRCVFWCGIEMDSMTRGSLLAPVAGMLVSLSRRDRRLSHTLASLVDVSLLEALAVVDWRTGASCLRVPSTPFCYLLTHFVHFFDIILFVVSVQSAV